MAWKVLGLCLFVLASVCHGKQCHDRKSCRDLVQQEFQIWPPVQDALLDMIDTRAFDENGDWLSNPNDVDPVYCPHNSYFEMLPTHPATAKFNVPVTWTGFCFRQITALLAMNGPSAATVRLTARDPIDRSCNEFLILSSSYDNKWVDLGQLNPNQTIQISKFVGQQLRDMTINGMPIMSFPCGIAGTVSSIVKTLGLFIGTPAQLETENIKFVLERKIWPAVVPFGKQQYIDKSLIKSGDYFAIVTWDGLATLIEYGTGGTTSHSAIAVWDGPELFVCESLGEDPFTTWPAPFGVIRTPYDQWIQQALKVGYMTNLLPIRRDFQPKFNEARFWAWFKTIQGHPYGYHNFLYSFLDTSDPGKNLPQPIDDAVLIWGLTGFDRLLTFLNGTDLSVFSLFTWGLNQRLNTKCGNISCISDKLLDLGSTLPRTIAIPERDEWLYGPNKSRVCSAFAASGWAAGFGPDWPSPYEGVEQTPKDNYQTAIFDPTFFTAANCPIGLNSDPNGVGSWCQLHGKHKLPLPGYNTVPLYANMNNKCPAQWPDYTRCPKDNPKCC